VFSVAQTHIVVANIEGLRTYERRTVTNDAAASCEAVSRPHRRLVRIQEVAPQDVQALHRARQLLIKQRTALCNQVRGLLSEYGIVVAKGVQRLRTSLPSLLEEAENGLTFPRSGTVPGALSAIGLVRRA
jgi:transposase